MRPQDLLKPLIKRTGFEIRRVRPPEPQFNRGTALRYFQYRASLANKPSLVLDIGANRGSWTRKLLTHFPETKVWMLEPQDFLRECSQDLIDAGRVEWLTGGAARESGTLRFTVADRDDSSNFRQSEAEARELGLEQRVVPVFSLNDLIAKMGRAPDWIKIDAEGLDMEVLNGGSEAFGKTETFFVEASIPDIGFENTLPVVMQFMDEKGYSLTDFTDLNYAKREHLLLVECVFSLRK